MTELVCLVLERLIMKGCFQLQMPEGLLFLSLKPSGYPEKTAHSLQQLEVFQ
ncbi:hypothetical protein AKJ16_DCAP13779 [Drosera capensis]